MSYRMARFTNGISKSSIRSRLNVNGSMGASVGRATFLAQEDERLL